MMRYSTYTVLKNKIVMSVMFSVQQFATVQYTKGNRSLTENPNGVNAMIRIDCFPASLVFCQS